jgi:hypothetical protein
MTERERAAAEMAGRSVWLGDEVGADDVLVFPDFQVAPLAEVDAFLLSARRRSGAGASLERLTVAVLAIDRVTSRDVRAADEGSLRTSGPVSSPSPTTSAARLSAASSTRARLSRRDESPDA